MTDTDPEFDPDEFEKQLAALFEDAERDGDPEEEEEVDPDVTDPDDGDGDQADDGADDATVSHAPVASAPSQVDILGREFNEADARSLVEFYDWVKQNPAQAIAIDNYLRGQAQFVPVGQEPAKVQPAEPEEDPLEDVDPALRKKLAEIDELRAKVDQYDQQQQTHRANEIENAVSRGKIKAQEKYGLSEEEADELMAIGANMNVVQGIAQQKNGDFVGAVEETLDLAYWNTEKFRDQAVLRFAQQQATEQKRQKKASSISGGSGSVPRTTKEPSTNEGRREAMVSAIAEAMAEQTQE